MSRIKSCTLTALVALAALTLAAPAQAGKTQESIFQDDATLLGDDAAKRDRALDELQSLGVDTVRALVLWNRIAPDALSSTKPAFDASDPDAYPAANWGRLDALVQGAQERGIDVLLTPTGPGPGWASDCSGDYNARRICRPNPEEYGAFVTAIARRYPSVRRWSIWNEPNQGGWLTPQYSITSKGATPEAPHRYRRLVQAATAALAATGHGNDQVLLGETAPIGRTGGALATRSLSPVVFWRELLCLDSRGRALTGSNATARDCRSPGRLAVTGAAHHPYTRGAGRPPTDSAGRDDITLASIGRLSLWLDRGARAGRLPRSLPIYSTEFGFQTNPPDRSAGVSLSRQAEYLNQSEYMSWVDGRLRSVAQYELFDERDLGAFQTGLRFEDGRAKPGLDAYRLPIWAFQKRGYTYVWGMVRRAHDAAQTVRVEYYDARTRRWKRVRTVSAGGSDRFVYLRTRANGKYFRLVAGEDVSRKAVPR
jgi:hypothetical protein